jgi:hypothetical protein
MPSHAGLLASREELPFGSRRARERMQSLREEYAFLGDAPCPLAPTSTGYRLWTFAGGRANLLLARTLESILGAKTTAGNLFIGLHEQAGRIEYGHFGRMQISPTRQRVAG